MLELSRTGALDVSPPLQDGASRICITLSPRGEELLSIVESAGCSGEIDAAMRELYKAHALLTENELKFLDAAIRERRIALTPPRKSDAVALPASRSVRRFPIRKRQRSPNLAESRERRRIWAGSSALPPSLRKFYTEGSRAVLAVIAAELKKRNAACELSVGQIAAIAGVCCTTVQTTLQSAQQLEHLLVRRRPQRGRKHLTNVIQIASHEWLTWFKSARRAARIGSNIPKTLGPTESK